MVKGIPSNEIVWVKYIDGENRYYITSKSLREYYYIYKAENGQAKKLGQAKSPLTLEEKFIKSLNNSEKVLTK